MIVTINILFAAIYDQMLEVDWHMSREQNTLLYRIMSNQVLFKLWKGLGKNMHPNTCQFEKIQGNCINETIVLLQKESNALNHIHCNSR